MEIDRNYLYFIEIYLYIYICFEKIQFQDFNSYSSDDFSSRGSPQLSTGRN